MKKPRIASAKLFRFTGGQPARYILISKEGDSFIAIRPKRRNIRMLKQVKELSKIAEILNANSGRELADPRKVTELKLMTIGSVVVFGGIVLMSLIMIVRSL